MTKVYRSIDHRTAILTRRPRVHIYEIRRAVQIFVNENSDGREILEISEN